MEEPFLFKPEDYPNQLSLLKITTEDILGQIRDFSLHFFKERNYKVEKKMRFPPFVKAFYNFVYQYNRVPEQEEYYKYYLTVNQKYFSSKQYDGITYLGLQARVYRLYPSFVRELYFNKLLEKNNEGFEIVYNVKLDLENDIDTLLIKNNNYWAACLFIETDNSETAREWKKARHSQFDNVSYIELPVDFAEERKLGDFFLYGEPEVAELFTRINHPHISKKK